MHKYGCVNIGVGISVYVLKFSSHGVDSIKKKEKTQALPSYYLGVVLQGICKVIF